MGSPREKQISSRSLRGANEHHQMSFWGQPVEGVGLDLRPWNTLKSQLFLEQLCNCNRMRAPPLLWCSPPPCLQGGGSVEGRSGGHIAGLWKPPPSWQHRANEASLCPCLEGDISCYPAVLSPPPPAHFLNIVLALHSCLFPETRKHFPPERAYMFNPLDRTCVPRQLLGGVPFVPSSCPSQRLATGRQA